LHIKGNQGSLRFSETSIFTDEATSRLTSDPVLTDATVEFGSSTVDINSGTTARYLARERTMWNVAWQCGWVFVFAENKVKCTVYRDKLQLFAFPQTEDIESGKETAFVFLQEAASPHPLHALGSACPER